MLLTLRGFQPFTRATSRASSEKAATRFAAGRSLRGLRLTMGTGCSAQARPTRKRTSIRSILSIAKSKQLARIRTSHRALTRGFAAHPFFAGQAGMFAVSRFEPGTGREMLLVFQHLDFPPIKQKCTSGNTLDPIRSARRRLPRWSHQLQAASRCLVAPSSAMRCAEGSLKMKANSRSGQA